MEQEPAAAYEAPVVTDLGTLADITRSKGNMDADDGGMPPNHKSST